MLVRQIVIPTSPERLWTALTAPEDVAAWFGARVEWDLRPGGRARFLDDDGSVRNGVIDSVLPGRHLRFRWWPEHEEPEGTSQVSYDLEPGEEGTVLTVTEQPLMPAAGSPTTASACAQSSRPPRWTAWDDRLFGCWAQVSARVCA